MIPGHPTLKLDPYAGPLDLLLHLIQEDALDISLVSISQITDKYLERLFLMQDLDIELASEFLVMAATLVMLKSKALLPSSPQALEDGIAGEQALVSQEELLERLRWKKIFLHLGEQLMQRNILGKEVFIRESVPLPVQKLLRPMNLTALIVAYQYLLVCSQRRFTILKKETVSILDKIRDLKGFPLNEWLTFEQLLVRGQSISERVATFLAILELCRLKKSLVQQEKIYEVIFLKILDHFEEDLDTFKTDFKEMVG